VKQNAPRPITRRMRKSPRMPSGALCGHSNARARRQNCLGRASFAGRARACGNRPHIPPFFETAQRPWPTVLHNRLGSSWQKHPRPGSAGGWLLSGDCPGVERSPLPTVPAEGWSGSIAGSKALTIGHCDSVRAAVKFSVRAAVKFSCCGVKASTLRSIVSGTEGIKVVGDHCPPSTCGLAPRSSNHWAASGPPNSLANSNGVLPSSSL
jgi:hypothetical protein